MPPVIPPVGSEVPAVIVAPPVEDSTGTSDSGTTTSSNGTSTDSSSNTGGTSNTGNANSGSSGTGRTTSARSTGGQSAVSLSYPIIAGYGGVVPLPQAAEQPRRGAKVVFDVTADAEPGQVNPGLERVARLINLYGAAGLSARDVSVTVVLNGGGVKSALSATSFRKRYGGRDNADLPLVEALRQAGASVYVCGQSLRMQGYSEAEMTNEATVAAAAVSVITNRQADGFSYIPAH